MLEDDLGFVDIVGLLLALIGFDGSWRRNSAMEGVFAWCHRDELGDRHHGVDLECFGQIELVSKTTNASLDPPRTGALLRELLGGLAWKMVPIVKFEIHFFPNTELNGSVFVVVM